MGHAFTLSLLTTSPLHRSLSFNKLSGTLPNIFSDMLSLVSLYVVVSDGIPLVHFSRPADRFISMISLELFQRTFLMHRRLLNCKNQCCDDARQSPFCRSWLHVNKFVGTIPSSIGDLSQLESLYLMNNYLSGTIPSSISRLSQLREL